MNPMMKQRTRLAAVFAIALPIWALLAALNFMGAALPQGAPVDIPAANDTTVRLTTQLGVTKTIPVNSITDNDPVIKELLGSWNIDQANFMAQTEKGVYIVIPQEIFRSAEAAGGKNLVKLSKGESLQGSLVGTLSEGATATGMQRPVNIYPLEDCVKLELLTIDSEYTKYHAENPDRTNENPNASHWSVFLNGKNGPSFQIIHPLIVYKYFSTVGYIMGGETRVEQTGSFEIAVADKTHTVNIDDFKEIRFSIRPGDHEIVTLESNSGIKTSGTIAIAVNDRGDLYLLGELVSNPRLKVAIKLAQCRLQRED